MVEDYISSRGEHGEDDISSRPSSSGVQGEDEILATRSSRNVQGEYYISANPSPRRVQEELSPPAAYYSRCARRRSGHDFG